MEDTKIGRANIDRKRREEKRKKILGGRDKTKEYQRVPMETYVNRGILIYAHK